MKKHSRFSASASERWLNCPGSVTATEGMSSPENKYSLEGSAAHCLAELTFDSWVDIEITIGKFLSKKPSNFISLKNMMNRENSQYGEFLNPEMVDYVAGYVSRVKALKEEHDADLFIEHKVQLKKVHADCFGTVDMGLIDRMTGNIWVKDFKYGRGQIVPAKNNSQLAYYGLGFAYYTGWNFNNIHMSIDQPRANHNEEWSLDEKGLKEWETRFKEGVKAALAKNPTFKSNAKWCKYCPINGTCKTRLKDLGEVVQSEFEGGTLFPVVGTKTVQSLSIEEIAKVLDAQKNIETFLTDVRAHAIRELEAGRDIPGYKLVDKRGMRVWNQKLPKSLTGNAKLWKKEFLSPAQAEKVIKKSIVDEHTVMVISGKTIAPIADKRPKRKRAVELDFE